MNILRKLKRKNLDPIKSNFKTVKKTRIVLDAMINQPVIFIHKKQNLEYVYAALIDDYESRELCVYHLHLLVRSHINPKESEWLRVGDFLHDFYVPEITKIYAPTDPDYGLEHAMSSWLNPFVKPIRGILCDWNGVSKRHSKYCNDDLHESLSFLYRNAVNSVQNRSDSDKLEKSLKYIINYLVVMGKAKIPTGYP